MTIQVAIRGKDGSVVLAGDTKARVSERTEKWPDTILTNTSINYPKIVLAEKHEIAVAMAGEGNVGTDAADGLAKHLSSFESIPEYLDPKLKAWGDRVFRLRFPDATEDFSHPLCEMLVVNPHAEKACFFKLRVNYDSNVTPSNTLMVNGHDSNPAVFWLEYMNVTVAGGLSLEHATNVAIATVAMAAKINPYGIGRLEVHQFDNGLWRTWTPSETTAAEIRCAEAQEEIKRLILQCANPDSPTHK